MRAIVCREQFLDLVARKALAHASLGEVGDHALRGFHTHIGPDKQVFEALEHGIVEHAARGLGPVTSDQTPQKAGARGGGGGRRGRGIIPKGGVRRLFDNRLKSFVDFGRGFEQPFLEFREKRHAPSMPVPRSLLRIGGGWKGGPAQISSAKWRMVRRMGLGAACPSPQIEASAMVWHSSSRSG